MEGKQENILLAAPFQLSLLFTRVLRVSDRLVDNAHYIDNAEVPN